MQFDLQGVAVMIGIPVNRDFPWQTTKSLMETSLLMQNKGVPLNVQFITGNSMVSHARTFVADAFLKSKSTHLFMIDSDQSWKEADFLRVLCLATKMQVVGATYPAKRLPASFMLMPEAERVETNEYGCIPVRGMGLGFTCVQRQVIQRLADQSPRLKFHNSSAPIPHLFRCDDVLDGQARGEDMSFFADCRALGYQAWLDPSIDIGHVGGHEFAASFKDALTSH